MMEFAANIRAILSPSISSKSNSTAASASTGTSTVSTDTKSNKSVTNKPVTGSAEAISKLVYTDIHLVKQEIQSYNQITNVFGNQFYYKLYKLIETNQSQELDRLKRRYHHNFTPEYYRALVVHYKGCVQEYDDFLQLIQYNLNNGLVTKESQNGRKLSDIDPEQLDRSLPEDLVDPLSLELFADPVITPSGVTYEKSLILAHISTNGPFDPVTKQTITADQLYPNLAIKNSVNHFIRHQSKFTS